MRACASASNTLEPRASSSSSSNEMECHEKVVKNDSILCIALSFIINYLQSMNLPLCTSYYSNKRYVNVFYDPITLTYVCLESQFYTAYVNTTETKIVFENESNIIKSYNVNCHSSPLYEMCKKCNHKFLYDKFKTMQCYKHPYTVYNQCDACLKKCKIPTFEKHVCTNKIKTVKLKKCYKLQHACQKCGMKFKYKCELNTHFCNIKYFCYNCLHVFATLFLLKQHINRSSCKNEPVLTNVKRENET